MNGYRFYLEFSTTYRKKKSGKENKGHSGNVCAISTDKNLISARGSELMFEGLVSVFDHPNSPVNWSGASWGYLRSKCKRISEAKARQIHPVLFQRLDETD